MLYNKGVDWVNFTLYKEVLMKSFLRIFAGILFLVEVFLFFGGALLFDFHNNLYGAGAVCAFLLALPVYIFLRAFEKIEALEARVSELEAALSHTTDFSEKEQ